MVKQLLHRGLAVKFAFLVAPVAAGFLPAVQAAEPMVILMPTSINFGKQPLDTSSAPHNIALANNGTAELTITDIIVTGGNRTDFSQTHNCPLVPATLAAGASCAISVTFKPSITGVETATLSVSDNASGSPQSVELSGSGTPAVPGVRFTPVSLNFGNQAAGTTSEKQAVTLTNTGSATLSITSSIVITGRNSSEFALVTVDMTCPTSAGQLPARASCAIVVRFAPASAGAKTAQITVLDDAEGSPHVVPLSGMGTAK